MKHKLFLLILILILMVISPLFSYADVDDLKGTIAAPGYAIVDASDPETLLYAGAPDKHLAPGSTTKIMTCILTLENCPDLDQVITISPYATRLGKTNSLMGLKKEENISIRDLLYGLMLESGNDAALALAFHISGSVEDFAALMNSKALELNMNDTNFLTPSGVFKGKHYASAHDMVRLASYAMQNETFRQICSTVNYTVPPNDVRKYELNMTNTNQLISDPPESKYFYPNAIGIKTGSTQQGGKCLVSAAEKDGVVLICSTLGLLEGGNRSQRMNRIYSDSIKLFESAFEHYYSYVYPEELNLNSLFSVEAKADNYRITDPDLGRFELVPSFDGQQAFVKNEIADGLKRGSIQLEKDITYSDTPLSAPVHKGDTYGSIKLSYNGRILFESELKADRDIEEYDPADEATPTPEPTALPTAVPTVSESPEFKPLQLVFPGIILLLVISIILLLIALKRHK